ncbi:methyltransferase domain-containing protein [Kallotenue papyrolyticum]|uniref:methyltransferase domain-containing protein n=1 Tax=Kallotenue papyrolyticum TaxID=1325125 RepID=UPI0004B73834|nr:methyltransferase domain-containing protein [Kallotenue papyrolyticum]
MARRHNRAWQRLTPLYELEIIEGLEAVVLDELRGLPAVQPEPLQRPGLIALRYAGPPEALLRLRSVQAVYARLVFPIPRPKALLGQQYWDQLCAAIDAVRALHPPEAFATFRISAAGRESSVMQRLRDQLAARTGLRPVAEEGDLLLRLRRPLDGSSGWEVLIRLAPRPLSARRWRVCNWPGALNATVAYAMAQWTRPSADDRVLNLMCGSATLLIERLMLAPARSAVGCDTDAQARACAETNLAAAGLEACIEAWDATALPVPEASFDVLLADLPFGQLIGSHQQNLELYPRVLSEAARVTRPGGCFCAITHELRLWERLVAAAAAWTLQEVWPIKLPFGGGYLRPRIYLLRRV